MKQEGPLSPVDASEEVAALITTLHDAQHRLEVLTEGEIDTVADRDGRTFLLRRAQEHLRQSDAAKQAAILNALPAHIALLDARGVIVSVNEAWRELSLTDAMHGPGHAIGLNYVDLCDSAFGEDVAEAHKAADGIRSVLSGAAKSFTIEYPWHSPPEMRWFVMMVTPLSDTRLNGAVVMHMNITERKRAEEEQRAAKQLLDNIIDNIPTAVQLKSVRDEYRIQIWNKAAAAMYGLPRDAAIGRNVHDLWPRADADRMHAADLELEASGEMQDFPDRPAQTKNRGSIRTHMRKVALRDARGETTHLLVVADDMTSQLADQTRLRDSEARFRSLSMLSSDWFWEQDSDHRFVRFSGGDNVLGWGPDQEKAVGLHRWDLGGVVPISSGWEEHKGVMDAPKPFRLFAYKRTLGDGRLQYVEASGEPILDAGGRFTGYRGVATDITARKEAENRIGRLNRVYAVLSGINTLIVHVRDRAELFKEACRIAVEHGGFTMAWIGMIDRSTMKMTPVASAGATQDYMALVIERFSLQTDAPGSNTLSARAIREKKSAISNDVRIDLDVPFKDEHAERGAHSMAMLPLQIEGEVVGLLVLYSAEVAFFDEAELKLLDELAGDIAFAIDHIGKQDRLDYLAYYDALTGLANRTLFLERVAPYMRSTVSGGHKLALFYLDIERFRNVNDSLGRPAGDALLKQVAEWLTLNVGDATLLTHLGADHFAIVLPEVALEGDVARLLDKRIRAFNDHAFRVGDTELRMSVRVGVALFPNDGTDADTLLRNAEGALKIAKANGDRLMFYTQQMTNTSSGKLTLENQLRQALDKSEFVLHYQPKISLDTGKLTSAEALIRWNDPRTGLVPPGRFIPVLEETGLIYDVGRWALRKAIEDYLRWRAAGLPAVRIAVNVSPLQLRNRGFIEEIRQVISIDAKASDGLELEITESLIMQDIKHSIASLQAIREMGVTIAIDDFGTGFSSLSYLSKLPVDALKIDRSFVTDMTTGPQGLALVSTIINLAHSLKLKVVAEGVETEDQSRLLRLLRCEEMQGFLFSKPVPAEEFEARFLVPGAMQ